MEDHHPLVLAKANAENNPRCHEAMNTPDAEGFQEALKIEYDKLQNKRHGLLSKTSQNIMSLCHLGYIS